MLATLFAIIAILMSGVFLFNKGAHMNDRIYEREEYEKSLKDKKG